MLVKQYPCADIVLAFCCLTVKMYGYHKEKFLVGNSMV